MGRVVEIGVGLRFGARDVLGPDVSETVGELEGNNGESSPI